MACGLPSLVRVKSFFVRLGTKSTCLSATVTARVTGGSEVWAGWFSFWVWANRGAATRAAAQIERVRTVLKSRFIGKAVLPLDGGRMRRGRAQDQGSEQHSALMGSIPA